MLQDEIEGKMADFDQRLMSVTDSDLSSHIEILECYASFLRQNKVRLLDATNMEAKAKSLKSKLLSEKKEVHSDSLTDEVKCSFCAEWIKREAKICRYCHKSTHRNPLVSRTYILAGGTGLIVFLLVCWFVFGQEKTTNDLNSMTIRNATGENSPVSHTGTVSGAAWVNKGSGPSEILRGLEVVLCDDTLSKSSLDRISGKYERYFVEDWPSSLGVARRLIASMYAVVSPCAVQATKTNVDGKYSLSSVPVGDYVIFAQYHSANSYMYWAIPVSIKNNESVSLDLDNSVAENIINSTFDLDSTTKLKRLRELKNE